MHPQNIFAEAILLFLVGILLMIRDRGSALASMALDPMLGSLLIVFSMIRLIEFLGSLRGTYTMAPGLVWFSWLIPLVIIAWLTYMHPRVDVIILLGLSIAAQIGVTIYLFSGAGGYNLILPDQSVGTSDGVYTWVRTDGATHFLPFTFYMLLTMALIYLTAFSIGDAHYWILTIATLAAFLIASMLIPSVIRNPLGTLGSLSTMVMLGVGVLAILLTPG